MRKNGVLCPIFSLPSKYGIGCFSKEAYEFVDFLEESGQKLWQILPLGPTSYGDSPYQSFSTFAGNPYFIDLESLIENKVLTIEDCNMDFGSNESYIDYNLLYENRYKVLKIAFENQKKKGLFDTKNFKDYEKDNSFWLDDYGLFMAIKNGKNGISWDNWEKELIKRDPSTLEKYRELYKNEILFEKYIQFEFYTQWKKLKDYANKKNIEIVGDIPIYVAFDSADVWSNQELFELDENKLPKSVAGCPPDAFSADGQLWGNPIYNWEEHEKEGFSWWIKRIKNCFKLYDCVRIDHFRGFDTFYSIPYGEKTAKNGKWVKGPGMKLFNAIKNTLGNLNIIAEDLGFITDSVRKLLDDSGFPGMKVLEFAFDSREDSDYLPHNYTKNSVVYTGTHDNDTIMGWYEKLPQSDLDTCRLYMNNYGTKVQDINWDFIMLAMRSVSDTCIIPIGDIMAVGSEGRINIPSTLGFNWKWRIKDSYDYKKYSRRLLESTIITGRKKFSGGNENE